MDSIKSKTAVITFIEKGKLNEVEFEDDTKLFSLPYNHILDAQEFCFNETLDYCYLGLLGDQWVIQASDIGLESIIKVTAKGISSETLNMYMFDIVEI